MNRHKSNWSNMSPGFCDEDRIRPVSTAEYYKLIRDTFINPYPQDCLANLLKAVRKIKEEFNI